MRKDKPETFNCYVPQKYLDLVKEQQEVYPLLKPSDIIGNIVIMRELLESYKDDEVQLNKSP